MKPANRFRRNLYACCAVALIAIIFAACKKPSTPVDMEGNDSPELMSQGYWTEDFNGPIDPQRWKIITGSYGWSNKESHWYQSANLEVSNGTLKIIAKKETITGRTKWEARAISFATDDDGVMRAAPQEGIPEGTRYWTAGMINTRDAGSPKYFPLFGNFEIKARLPHGQGLLPAFWLRRKNGGAGMAEVDVMEYFGSNNPGHSKFSLHFPNSLGYNYYRAHEQFDETVDHNLSDWHTWVVTIRPSKTNPDPLKDPIEFVGRLFKEDGSYIRYAYCKVSDEKTLRILRMRNPDTGDPIEGQDSTEVWDMCVNMAVGGKWVGQPDQQLGYLPMANRCSMGNQPRPPGGNPNACSTEGLFFANFPATFEVDHIRYYPLK